MSFLLSGLMGYDRPGAVGWSPGTRIGIHLLFNGGIRLTIWSAVRKAVTGPAPAVWAQFAATES